MQDETSTAQIASTEDLSIEELDAVDGGAKLSTLTTVACPVSTLTSILPD